MDKYIKIEKNRKKNRKKIDKVRKWSIMIYVSKNKFDLRKD